MIARLVVQNQIGRAVNKKERKILALDLGTKTGWATNTRTIVDIKIKPTGDIALNDSRYLSGTRIFDGEISGWRYRAFKGWLDVQIERLKIQHIVYEETFSKGAYAARILHGFLAVLQYVYAEHYPTEQRFTMQKVHPGTLKKFATGNGHAKKEQMIKACHVKFGYTPADDNEADALLLLQYQIQKDEKV